MAEDGTPEPTNLRRDSRLPGQPTACSRQPRRFSARPHLPPIHTHSRGHRHTYISMFPTAGLFQKLPCPEKQSCKRTNCLFNHSTHVKEVLTVHIPVETPKATPSSSKSAAQQPIASTSRATPQSHVPPPSIPAKRAISSPLRTAGASNGLTGEPPKKLQRIGTAQKATAKPTLSVAAVRSVHLCKHCL